MFFAAFGIGNKQTLLGVQARFNYNMHIFTCHLIGSWWFCADDNVYYITEKRSASSSVHNKLHSHQESFISAKFDYFIVNISLHGIFNGKMVGWTLPIILIKQFTVHII